MRRRRRRYVSYLRRALGLAALVAACFTTPASADLVSDASLEAQVFWQARGHTIPCAVPVTVGRLERPVYAAESSWYTNEDGDIYDCHITVAPWLRDEVNERGLDRFERRHRLVDLWIVMAHEYGHLISKSAAHDPTGIMSEDVTFVPPPAEAIEWAIKLTPRRTGGK